MNEDRDSTDSGAEEEKILETEGGGACLDAGGGETVFAFASPDAKTRAPAAPLPASDRRTLEALWARTMPSGQTLDAADPGLTYKPPPGTGGPSLARPRPDRSTLHSTTGGGGGEGAGMKIPDEPGYHLIDMLGEGGMGIVWRGFQGALLRDVAIKQIKPGHGAEEQFTGEALVTGFLDHPNIVPVHTLGQDDQDRLFLSMKLVQGVSWKDLLHPETEAHRLRSADFDLPGHLRILLSVCNAVAFAHSRRILHRDLKPENVMVGEYGEVLVMDWGIALDFGDGPESLRRTRHCSTVADPGGTPAYMAPEMAMGEGEAFGPWTDVYLLGAILHEILTGAPPHRGETVINVLIAAERSSPPSFPEGVPAELASICRKAMAREPAERFQDVHSFRKAVEDYLEHRESLIISDRAGKELEALTGSEDAGSGHEERYARYADVVSRFGQALELWPGNRAAAEGRRGAALAYAQAALGGGDLGLAESQLGRVPGPDPEAEVLAGRIREARAEVLRRARNLRLLRRALAAAMMLIIAGLATGTILVRQEQKRTASERDRANEAREAAEAARAQEIIARAAAEESAEVARKNQDEAERELYGSRIVQAQMALERNDVAQAKRALDRAPQRLRNWEWGYLTREADPSILTLEGHTWSLTDTVPSPDGKLVATSSARRLVKLWDGESGRLLTTWRGFEDSAEALRFSPDGKKLLAVHRDGRLRTFDVESGAISKTVLVEGADDGWSCAAFSPDGARFAVTTSFGGVTEWGIEIRDFETGQVVHTLKGHGSPIPGLFFRADGRRLVSASFDKTVKTWDLETGAQLLTLTGHKDYVRVAVFSPDGKLIVSGSDDQTLGIWDAESGKRLGILDEPAGSTSVVAFHPGGGVFAAGGADRKVRLFDAAEGRCFQTLRGHAGAILTLAWAPDGNRLLTGGSGDFTVKVWTPWAGSFTPWRGEYVATSAVLTLGKSSAVLAFHGTEHAIQILDMDRGALLATVKDLPHRIGFCFAPSPDARRIAFGTEHGRILVRDAATGEELRAWTAGQLSIQCLAFDPEGLRIASGSADRTVRVWDGETGAEKQVFRGHEGNVTTVAFSPDGKTLASGGYDRTVFLWDLEEGRAKAELHGHRNWVTGLGYSPDGLRLASAERGRCVKLWDVESASEILTLDVLSPFVGFYAGGRRMALMDRQRRLHFLESSGVRARCGSAGEFAESVGFGDFDRAAAILRENPAVVEERLRDGKSPLHFASALGTAGLVDLCLEKGARTGAADNFGNTALHLAVQGRRAGIAKRLLDAGADPNAEDDHLRPPLHAAARNEDLETARLLLEAGADVNAGDNWASYPLTVAVGRQSVPVVKILLERGAEVNVSGFGNATPLHQAAFLGNVEIILLLLEGGADTGAKERTGKTPLHQAFWSKTNLRGEAVRLLLERGADAGARDENDVTPLHIAATRGDTSLIRLLIEKGVDVNVRDFLGMTPLGEALEYKNEEAAELLRQHGGKE